MLDVIVFGRRHLQVVPLLLDIAPELMLRKKTLEALRKSGYPDGPYQLPDSLRGWRRERMGQALLEGLEKRP